MIKRLSIFSKLLILGLSFLVFQESAAQWVYKTPSGAKYHTDKCHTVKNVSDRLSLTHALKKGSTGFSVSNQKYRYLQDGRTDVIFFRAITDTCK